MFEFFLLSPLSLVLRALAIIHFIKRRPDTYWLWIIIIGGWIGALVYLCVEAVPDVQLLRGSFQAFPRRKRIHELEALVQVNPAAGNYEELADLYFQDNKYQMAREAYDKSISSRTDSLDPYYRRGVCSIELGDFPAALTDLEKVVTQQFNYDLSRAAGLLAHAYAQTGQADKAAPLFAKVTQTSTLSETQYNYANFLASQGRHAEAREWAQRILLKKPALPGYLRRRERPWFRKSSALLGRLKTAS